MQTSSMLCLLTSKPIIEHKIFTNAFDSANDETIMALQAHAWNLV